jgi:flagellar protein FlgJ
MTITGLATDTTATDALRGMAARDPKAAIKEAAKQFEALFMQELMKSMRQATMSSGMLDNEGTKLGTDMLDTQFATQMTGLRGGLSDVIARQLEKHMGLADEAPGVRTTPGLRAPAATESVSRGAGGSAAEAFVAEHQEAARAAERATGIPATFMIAQAAHETGWGRKEIRLPDGSTSHNLFGIKAGASWKGRVAEVTTTEYIDGQPQKVKARFRAYDTPEAAFADYARLMQNSPRYAQVVANAATAEGFAQGLQRAGYATDPQYADKLTRVINTTVRLQRALS